MTSATKSDDARLPLWGTLAVLIVTFALYAPSIGNKFAMDDTPIASSQFSTQPGKKDPLITAHYDDSATAYLKKFFVNHYWWPEQYNDGLYRPISTLSYGLVYQAIGRHLDEEHEAAPQHAVNVVLHTWAVWLVIRLLITVGATAFVSLVTGLLFGVHAIHSEVVAGIIGRAEIFSFCFGAQALLLMTRGGLGRNLVAGVLLFLAFGSKESSLCWIPFYFCFVLARQWMREPGSDWLAPLKDVRALQALAVMAVPCALFFVLRDNAIHHGTDPLMDSPADFSSNPLVVESTGTRIMTATKVWGFALLLCFAPYQLSCLYSPFVFDVVSSPADFGFLASIVVILAFLVTGLWFARRLPLLFLAMTCFLGFSFVTSNIPLTIGTILGERLYYTPSLGICILPGIVWPFLCSRGRPVFVVFASLWAMGNVGMALHRTHLWRDSGAIFLHDVQTYPRAIDLHRKCAAVYASDGPRKDEDKALEHLREARMLKKDYVHAYREAANIHFRRGEWKKAIEEFKATLECDYDQPAGADSIAIHGVGDSLMRLAGEEDDPSARAKLVEEAIGWFRRTLTIPRFGESHGDAHNKIGNARMFLSEKTDDPAEKLRLRKEAVDLYKKAIAIPGGGASRTKAFQLLFKNAVEPTPILSKEEFAQHYAAAHDIAGGEYELTLLMGEMAYKVGLHPKLIFDPLNWAANFFPEEKRDRNFHISLLFYADAILELSQDPQGRQTLAAGHAPPARQVLRMLLARDGFPEEYKAQIRLRLQNDPRLR